MSWLVIACGILLAAGGGYSIVSGAPYTQMEFGWTEVIAGTTALTGGLVTIALGALLHRLGALQKVMARMTLPVAAAAQIPDGPAIDDPPPLVPAPDLSDEDTPRIVPSPAEVRSPVRPAADAPSRSLFSGLSRRLRSARRTSDDAPGSLPEPHPGAPAPLGIVSSPRDATGDAAPEAAMEMEAGGEAAPGVDDAERRDGAGDTGGRDIVGRYEAGGASYVLFSDGTIEVETATGTHRFASMEELKAFVERQDAEKAALDL
ncbi:MAG TPA: hypothetical protein VH414_04155 [Lichenihabitans sp.]|jgi:hypothetical protein|nr:hypothetical protein [Lichenihabitans sp.]